MSVLYFLLGLALLVAEFLIGGGGKVIGIFFHPQAFLAALTVPIFLAPTFGFKESMGMFFRVRPISQTYKHQALHALGLVYVFYVSGTLAITMANIGSGPEVFGELVAGTIGGIGIGATASLWLISSKGTEESKRGGGLTGVGLLTSSLFAVLIVTFATLWMVGMHG